MFVNIKKKDKVSCRGLDISNLVRWMKKATPQLRQAINQNMELHPCKDGQVYAGTHRSNH